MAKSRRRSKKQGKTIASERIERLFELADGMFKRDSALSNRYVQLAKRIGMRHRVTIPREYKMRICKGCEHFLVPGANTRVRLLGTHVSITCLNCGTQKRYPYRKDKSNVSIE